MKVIICGPIITRDIDACIEGGIPDGGRFLNNMVSGLQKICSKVLKLVYIANPVINDKIYELIAEEEKKGDYFFQIKGNNIVRSVLKYRNKVLKFANKGDIVIFYNMIYPYFGLVNKLKQKNVKPVLFYADHSDVKDVYGMINKIRAFLEQKEQKQFNYVVTLADFNPNHFRSGVKHITIRGGINFEYFKHITIPQKASTIKIMFAGSLNHVTGIDTLLRAVELVKSPKAEFYISGRGELQEDVKKMSNSVQNLHYLGFLSEKEYFSQLNEIHIFLNPRNMELGENHNNFPSKVMEYLATGRIIISTKFSGYEDFLNEIIFYEGNEYDLAECIEKVVCDYTRLAQKYYRHNRQKAIEYDWNAQAKKIFDFVSQV